MYNEFKINELIILYQITRDDKYFTEIYNITRPFVYAYSKKLVKDHYIADDIVSLAFMGIFKEIDKYKVGESVPFKGWLAMSAKTYIYRHWERQKQKRQIRFIELETSYKDGDTSEYQFASNDVELFPNPDWILKKPHDFIDDALYNDILKEINNMKPHYRDVFIYRYIDQMDIKDIEHKLGKTKSDIAQIIKIGTNKLKSIFGNIDLYLLHDRELQFQKKLGTIDELYTDLLLKIDKLPDISKEAITLRYIEGLNFADCIDKAKISGSNQRMCMKSRIEEAIIRLKSMYGEIKLKIPE